MRQLGPYQLLRKIGSGGMAEVWSARIVGTHPGEDRFFALKLLASHLSEREEYREMFLAEARLSMALDHANIVRVYDAVAEDGCYMVMELVSGMTLSQFQRAMSRAGHAIPLHISAFIIGELLRALSYAHTVRTEGGSIIVHRDVSPQNVMVTAEGEVKLMDFGIARFASEETQGAFVKGKLQYMPPEQLRKQTKKPTVDLYAVGAMLHELLDGQRFRGKLPQPELLRMVMHGEVPALLHPTEVPSAIDMVRRGLLEADEHERIQTARKALGMLARWPGYRESNAELRALVENFVDVNSVFQIPESTKVSSIPEGSFSGVPVPNHGGTGEHPAASSDAELGRSRASPSVPAVPYSPGPPPTGGYPAAGSTGGHPVVPHATGGYPAAGSGAEQIPAVEAVLEAVPSSRRSLAPLVLGVLLLVGALAVAAFFLLGGDSEDPEVASATATATGEAATAVPPSEVAATSAAGEAGEEPASTGEEPASTGEEPASTGEEPASTGAEPEAESGEPEPEAESGEPKPEAESGEAVAEGSDGAPEQPAELVPVEFVANEFFFVYVRVKGRVMGLEPRRRIQLPPGKHRVQLRVDEDAPWKTAGRIELEAGGNYRIEMTKPAGLNVVKK